MVEYAKQTLTLGMIYLEFKDGIKERDGTRVLHCWKHFLPYFHATDHTNYYIEAFKFLALYILQCFAEQILWDVSSTRLAKRT